MSIKLLGVVRSQSIYHGCSNRKTFWEEHFTPGDFTPINMKKCGCRNDSKHREISNGEKYITLDISLKFVSLYKMKIISSEPKDYLGRSGKGLIIYLGIKTIGRSKKKKKARYSITNVSMKDIHNIIKEFEKLPL